MIIIKIQTQQRHDMVALLELVAVVGHLRVARSGGGQHDSDLKAGSWDLDSCSGRRLPTCLGNNES